MDNINNVTSQQMNLINSPKKTSFPPLPPLPPLPKILALPPKEKTINSSMYVDDDKAQVAYQLEPINYTLIELTVNITREEIDEALELAKNPIILSKHKRKILESHINKLRAEYIKSFRNSKILLSEREQAIERIAHYEFDIESLIKSEVRFKFLTKELEEKEILFEYKEVSLNEYFNIAENSTELDLDLKLIRSNCKDMVKEENAMLNHSGKDTKEQKNLLRLILKAYNIEVENVITKTDKSTSILKALKRLDDTYLSMNKMGSFHHLEVSADYHLLRRQEVELAFKYKQKRKQEMEDNKTRLMHEAEDRAAEKEVRENLKLLEDKEIADKEEIEAIKTAINNRRIELAKPNSEEMKRIELLGAEKNHYMNAIEKADPTMQSYEEKLQILITRFEELQEGMQTGRSLIANRRAGYVYVISNIGAFGEGIIKIGLSRRLEPMNRVKELSSASVPFIFDVHTMHFSKDAVGLEGKLHEKFAQRAVNRVNEKKEFFRVTPVEAKEAILEFSEGVHLEFTDIPLAEDYWASIKININGS